MGIDTYEPTGEMFESLLFGKVRFKGEVMEWVLFIWLIVSWFWLMDG